MNEQKELEVVKTQTDKAFQAVSVLSIKTSDDYKKAEEIRGKVKSVAKMIDTKKKEITQPINDSLKRIRDIFKPIETSCEDSLEILEGKMIAFRREEDARIAKDKEKIMNKVETGYIKPETAVKKVIEVGNVKSNLKEAGVTTSVRKLARVKIVEESAIPREYLVVSEKLVFEALKAGKQVAGAELYYEEIIA